ncbi:uncharacterized protein LOC143599106 [Bidens hawaiensis]|uniref:uncharacterized protein LOC143599106 n=1 Tax=Bidens hawaiensis TaxID=980011 RepID=UPI00404A87B3
MVGRSSKTSPLMLVPLVSPTHYAGPGLGMQFRDGKPWKKVFGPVFIYLNSVTTKNGSHRSLWDDAKLQMLAQTESWPYQFPSSSYYPRADQRGLVTCQLLVHDVALATFKYANIGLAPPGPLGSWQNESKGYQFWTETDEKGFFEIKNVRPGNYYLYAWVPGYIGEYMHPSAIYVSPGKNITMGQLVHKPPRNGPTVWEIGVPDRTAAEFYVPEPNPRVTNRFRQYGLWDQYTVLYPDHDLIYTVGVSDYKTDWFFAHVNRNAGNNNYVPTTWTVTFDLDAVIIGNYTIQLALASATAAEVQIRINDRGGKHVFTTGLIGNDNAIARHGIHGLRARRNAMFLTQARGPDFFRGVMYDYIRLEIPPHF